MLLVCGLLASACAASQPLEILDDRGVRVRLRAPAARIAVLAPHLTELAFAAGAGERVVGVSSFTDWPPEARRLPVVADGGRVNREALIGANPDLVLAWIDGNRVTDLARISALGIPVIATSANRMDDVPRLIRMIGLAAGAGSAAESAASAFEGGLATLSRPGLPPLRVFYEVWNSPLMTVNGAHWISDMLRRCGADNVLAGLPLLAGPVSMEQLYAADPDVIITGTDPVSLGRWGERRRLRAVASGRVVQVPADEMQRLGPRALNGLHAICGALDQARLLQGPGKGSL